MAKIRIDSLQFKDKIFNGVLDFFESHKHDDDHEEEIQKGRMICNTDVGCEEKNSSYVCLHPTCKAHAKACLISDMDGVNCYAILTEDKTGIYMIANFENDDAEFNYKKNKDFIECFDEIIGNQDFDFCVYTMSVSSDNVVEDIDEKINFIKLNFKKEEFFLKIPYNLSESSLYEKIGFEYC